MHFYDSRNLSGTLNIENKASHDIYLNYNSKHTRRKSKEEVITELQEKLLNFEETVEQNVIQNLQDQNAETWYWDWSVLDLTTLLSLNECIARILEIICLFPTKYVHIRSKYKNDKHEDVEYDL